MKKILYVLLALSFLVSLLLPVNASQAFMIVDNTSPEIIAQSISDVESFNCEVAAVVTGIPVSECDALVDFYVSTNGDGWNDNSGWLVEEDIDSWFGVTVAGGHVISLVLDHNSLSGPIPETISQLPFLDEICLLSNKVTGPLPDSLGEVLMLVKLSLSDNQISGEIPTSIKNLSNLEKLSIGENQLTGSIPAELSFLPKLDRIDLHSNQLSGEIPESLGLLSALTELILYDNYFTGLIPSSFVNLNNLYFFYFFATDLCERYDPDFLAWKETVVEWQGTGCICRIFFPIIFK